MLNQFNQLNLKSESIFTAVTQFRLQHSYAINNLFNQLIKINLFGHDRLFLTPSFSSLSFFHLRDENMMQLAKLTLSVPRISESCIEIKIKLNFGFQKVL